MTLNLSPDQLLDLNATYADDAGRIANDPSSNFNATYSLLLSDINTQLKMPGQALSDSGLYWYTQAQQVNIDASGSASSAFIRAATATGLIWDGSPVSEAIIQKTSNDIATAVFQGVNKDGIFSRGIVQDIDSLVATDVSTTLSNNNITPAGWGLNHPLISRI